MGIACRNVNVRNSFCFEHRQCPRGIGPKNAFARFNRATSLKGEHNGRLAWRQVGCHGKFSTLLQQETAELPCLSLKL